MADKFRRKKEPKHIRLYASITGSVAWQHLSGNAIKVLLALARYDDGKSNGELYFSERRGAKDTGLSRNTVRRSIAELIVKGFIAQTKPGAFNRNNLLAATYRLTWVAWPGGKPSAPTRDFEKWQPENSQAQILTETGSISDIEVETEGQGGSNIEPPWMETPHVSVGRSMSKCEPQVLYQGRECSELETDQWKHAHSTSGPFYASLRTRLAEHLSHAEPGEQTRLASSLGIPGGTLSKFINGRNLPADHAAALARALMSEAA